MVSNIDRIADSLDLKSPALLEVVTPDEPVEAKVLRISGRRQVARLAGSITRRI